MTRDAAFDVVDQILALRRFQGAIEDAVAPEWRAVRLAIRDRIRVLHGVLQTLDPADAVIVTEYLHGRSERPIEIPADGLDVRSTVH